MVKNTKVKIHAPFKNIPIGHNGKDVNVLMDRHFMNNLMDYITKKELKMIHCKVKGSHIILEFINKFEATKFALGYTEIYHDNKKPKIF
jgi:hypothetical protein